jgi:hypothetical protein
MIWKAIGQSVAGTSHTAVGKGCEDAIQYRILQDEQGKEVLVCCISDGAGSALHAAHASSFATSQAVDYVTHLLAHNEEVTEGHIYAMAEDIYYSLEQEALSKDLPLNEYSATMLGCIVCDQKAAFFQVGDGAIIRNDESGFYSAIWWPQNGEYQNSTSFLVDDSSFSSLQVIIIEDKVTEVALFTDGLQMLALSMESQSAHQPFFTSLFPRLRLADDDNKIETLNRKLAEYLDSSQINERTDDDKTLFLATRLPS